MTSFAKTHIIVIIETEEKCGILYRKYFVKDFYSLAEQISVG